MAKTYEAMVRAQGQEGSGAAHHRIPRGVVDLTGDRQKGDLEKKIRFFQQKYQSRIINFTSSRTGEGVTTLLVNLVNYMARRKSEKRILVVDANVRRPSLHQLFEVSGTPGLIDLLSGKADLAEVVHAVGGALPLDLLPAGDMGADGGQVYGLDPEELKEYFEKLGERYQYIFIDSPPLLTSGESLSTAVASDVTFLVIHANAVQKEVAEKAKLLLTENECFVGGVVLNRVKQVIPSWLYRIL